MIAFWRYVGSTVLQYLYEKKTLNARNPKKKKKERRLTRSILRKLAENKTNDNKKQSKSLYLSSFYLSDRNRIVI